MSGRHPFVVLEGLSGSGKSTCGRIVAERLAAEFLHTPLPPLDLVRSQVDEMALGVRYLFYLAAVAQASEAARIKLRHAPVVCDRYVLTTQCFHRAAGVSFVLDPTPLRLMEPDLTVLIVCEDGVRRKRMTRRGMSPNDRRERAPGLEDALLLQYRAYGLPEVDTTHRSPTEVADEILLLLKSAME